MEDKRKRVQELKKEKDAVLMAHYYVEQEVQEVADYIGDSYYLAKQAAEVEAGTIVLCGVSFMGESAKVLNEKKTVLLPDALADCPMAHMAGAEQIRKVREAYPSAAVVCYVNSTAELKRNADVCVTSANALKIVKALPNPVIYFIPDEHLGRFIAAQVPEKSFFLMKDFVPYIRPSLPKTFEGQWRCIQMRRYWCIRNVRRKSQLWQTTREVPRASSIMPASVLQRNLSSVRSWGLCMSWNAEIHRSVFTQ